MDINDKARPRFVTTLRRDKVRAPAVPRDDYELVADFRPSNLHLHLAVVGLVIPRPVLCVYRGRRTGHLIRHEVHI